MSDNPFAPPTADLLDADPATPVFYVVSRSKLVVMTLSTLGVYLVYWAYRNWHLYKVSTQARVLPLVRGFFLALFIPSLFVTIERRMKAFGVSYCWRPRLLATIFLLGGCITVGRIWIPGIYLNLGMLATGLGIQLACVIRVQHAINFFEKDPEGQQNTALSGLNWLWVALGASVIGLAGWGLYLGLTGGLGPHGHAV